MANSDMTHSDTPLVEYPLNYPIKVIGDNVENFVSIVSGVVKQFDPAFDEASVSLKPSRNGTFVSMHLSLWATSDEQLQKLYSALKQTGHVKMIL